jgi:uncharacterized pyridoxamine 5'-phosphate oxidase family protein
MLQQALDFLKSHNEVAFATCSEGSPKIRIFQIMKQENTTLYFATSAEKAVFKELKTNPNVEILSFAGQISVRCSGIVNFNVDDETKRWIYDNNPVLSRLYTSYDKLVYFSLPIAELDYYNLEPTPPLFRHIDLVEGTESFGFVGERFKTTNQ